MSNPVALRSLPLWWRAGVGACMASKEPRGSSRGGDAPIPTFPQRGKEKCTGIAVGA
jgi:hypothetical protein